MKSADGDGIFCPNTSIKFDMEESMSENDKSTKSGAACCTFTITITCGDKTCTCTCKDGKCECTCDSSDECCSSSDEEIKVSCC